MQEWIDAPNRRDLADRADRMDEETRPIRERPNQLICTMRRVAQHGADEVAIDMAQVLVVAFRDDRVLEAKFFTDEGDAFRAAGSP